MAIAFSVLPSARTANNWHREALTTPSSCGISAIRQRLRNSLRSPGIAVLFSVLPSARMVTDWHQEVVTTPSSCVMLTYKPGLKDPVNELGAISQLPSGQSIFQRPNIGKHASSGRNIGVFIRQLLMKPFQQ